MTTPTPDRFADAVAATAIESLAEARAAWIDYCQATTIKDHIAAVDRLNEALGIGEMDVRECEY